MPDHLPPYTMWTTLGVDHAEAGAEGVPSPPPPPAWR